MKLPSLSLLVDAFVGALRRFPLTMLSAAVACGALMWLVEDGSDDAGVKMMMPAMLGLPLFTAITAFGEAFELKGWRFWAPQVAGVGLLVLYYFQLDPGITNFENVYVPQYLGFLAIAHLLSATSPYLKRGRVEDFWEFNKTLFANFIVGAVYALILYAGLALAILAVDQLFDLNIDSEIYVHLFLLLGLIFFTAFFLHHFPQDYETEDDEYTYTTVFVNLCKFILIPIVGLYFLILYVYGAKIIAMWELPRGWVSSLVIGFSVAGIFTYLLNYRLPAFDSTDAVRLYHKWFWPVLLPLTVLLFVAIGRRINDYGITEERFYVAHAGLWLLAMGLYFLFSKNDNIKFIPLSLAAFILVAVAGPFSANRVARRSQVTIIRELLTKNGRFDGTQVQKRTTTLTGEDAERIISAMSYLESRDALGDIQSWLPMHYDSFPEADDNYSYAYNSASRIAYWLNIRQFTNITSDGKENLNLSVNKATSESYTDIRGYAEYFEINVMDSRNYSEATVRPKRYFRLSTDKAKMVMMSNTNTQSVPVDSFSMIPALQKWFAEGANGYLNIPVENATIELQGQKHKAMFILRDGNIYRKKDTLSIDYMNGILFVKPVK
ncbi:MAG: DUF4153 domain-containing protein [Saprospiraceae bacterium]|nr:DUF4153 domain-containing protein [Saprospiraceae bacterium]